MTWQPNVGPDVAKAREAMRRRTREYFREQNVLEVFTPSLVRHTVTEPNIDSIGVTSQSAPGYLHTSPEYQMKRLLAARYPDIYQVCRVFRDGEAGRLHLPEFTMVEWYRLGFGLRDIMTDAVDLLSRLITGRSLKTARYLSYADAFAGALGVDPLSASGDELADKLGADKDLRHSIGADLDAWLDLAMATRVAATFDADQLTIVYHYPANQAALARLCPDDARLADRFEIYCGPVELANGFVELTDGAEQERRFRQDQERRRASGKPVPELDDELLAALDAGLPDCAGVALGLDRTLMIAEGQNDIASVTGFTPGQP